MRITQISLTNFRSFRATQNIDIAPVTLFFGPNSVGKSSVLMALFYIQEILDKGRCDPVKLEALGEKYIGGFKSLVNQRDLAKKIVIKITAEKKGTMGESYNKLADLFDQDFGLTVESPTVEADKVAVEFHIAWSNSSESAYVANYKIWLDDRFIAELTSDSGIKQPVISYIDYRHPALMCEDDTDYLSDSGEGDFVSKFHELLNASRYQVSSTSNIHHSKDINSLVHVPISFKGFAGALPKLGRTLETVVDLDDRIANLRVHEILSDVIVAPLDNLLSLLKESLCIGPLRLIPDALYQKNPYPQQKDWYTGSAAWDLLGRSTTQVLEISHWLENKEALNLGYSIRNKQGISKSVYMGGWDATEQLLALHNVFGNDLRLSISKEDISENPEAENTPLDIESVKEIFKKDSGNNKKPSFQHLIKNEIISNAVLWDNINNIEVTTSDIGVGVSQLFPLVVAAVERQKGIIACEQPELHVHPRVQVAIGDLLTQTNNDTSFLIETHSEHLILRLLKRIRQTTDNELPEGLNPVKKEDVAINYLESSESGVKVKRIHIDEDGEFKEKWPQGFFVERREELL